MTRIFVGEPARCGCSLALLPLLCATTTTSWAAVREASPAAPLVIPIADVIGGTGVANNAKTNPMGGYFSAYDQISQFAYPATHGNQLGATAMVNDHTYWDSSPGGLDSTHAPHPDPGGGSALWWPIPGEWAAYGFTVSAPAAYTVLYRFSSSWGPGQPVIMHMTMDGVSSGPLTMKPDDPQLWKDTKYQVGGWWGHTMVSGTCPAGWKLTAGPHVLKVFIDKFPANPTDHGNIWIHYFKVLSLGAAGKNPSALDIKQIQAVNGAFAKAAETEKKGRFGQALVAYEKVMAGAQAGSEPREKSSAKVKELREQGDSRLAAANALDGAAATAALKQIADEYAGCDIAVTAAKAITGKAGSKADGAAVTP